MRKSRIVYYDTFSITVINPNGKMRQLYCPFLVKCITTIENIQKNSSVYVDQVFLNKDKLLSYSICGKHYSYSNFVITIHF